MNNTSRKTVIAICGSTKAASTNLSLIKAVTALAKDQFNITLFDGLTDIPHFNPDLDTETPPATVTNFRQALRNADGILICTPEYAMGVPGTLKNAIDWTVSSMEFSHKPVALITASSLGEKGHASLIETLKVIESDMLPETQLLISFIRTKVNSEGIMHEPTKLQVMQLIDAFYGLLNNPIVDSQQVQ
ncbi:MAG: NAD(P)H-dependent oxidoreductase [Bacteroidetes bacterium]|nr:NAD(P)H-dependent oxidoreductase [Bacteroidota bacterium]